MGPCIRQMGPGIALLPAPLAGADIDAIIDLCGDCEPAPGAFGDLEDCHPCQCRLYGRCFLGVGRHWWASVFGTGGVPDSYRHFFHISTLRARVIRMI